ncbi:MAG: hypothetical protein J5542_09870 [Bacteroidales bacterium]|nr:hypothetical protein [Bacteroidales bacterium]
MNKEMKFTENKAESQELRKEAFRQMHRRPQNINEDVMKRFWNIDSQCAPVLVEHVAIERLVKKYGDNGFVMISAGRSDESDERNTQSTRELINYLKGSGFAYLPLYGGNPGTDNDVDSFVPKFIVFNCDVKGNPMIFRDLYRFALDMCGKYSQDSVCICTSGESSEYRNAQGEKVNKKNDLPHELYVNPMPSSHTVRMRRKGEVMIWE